MIEKQRDLKTSHAAGTYKRHVSLAEQNPRLIFVNDWHHDPAFCDVFFDRCEDRALQADHDGLAGALELAHAAVEMAEKNGNQHLMNRGDGVLAHAHIARTDFHWAGKVLEGYRERAVACCSRCRSDFLRRRGDLLGEERELESSLEVLNNCIEEAGPWLTLDVHGRILFLRAISLFHLGQRIRALDDAGQALLEISLDSPRGFFLDIIAFLAVYIRGGEPIHDAMAFEHLQRFKERIKGLAKWQDVRNRIAWVEGHLFGLLGDWRSATRRLERAHRKLLVQGHPKEVAASGLDVALLRCRHPVLTDDNKGEARRTINACLEKRSDLAPDHREGLEEMLGVLDRYPENAFRELFGLRKTVVASVGGRLGERIALEKRGLAGK